MTRVVLSYILDTIRIDAQTIASILRGWDPRKLDSFEFGIQLSKEMVMPYIESRSLNRLQGAIQRRMSFIQQRQVGCFGYEPCQPVAAIAAGAATVAQGAAARARKSVTSFAQHLSKDESPKRCNLCYKMLSSEDHKAEKNKLSKVKTVCGSCGEACCQKYFNIICTECLTSFVPHP